MLLQDRLAAAGIRTALEGNALHFSLETPHGETITLAQPMAFPWLDDLEIETIGAFQAQKPAQPRFPQPPGTGVNGPDDQPTMPEFAALADANVKLARLLDGEMPPSLVTRAVDDVSVRLTAYLNALL